MAFEHLKKETGLRAVLIVCFAAIFYCYEFTLQSSPAVITHELLRDFSLDAASLSVLAAFFFYAYAPTQLLGGMLYDRFGPRILITLAAMICAFGTLLFALGPSVAYLSAGRFLMGIGGAFSFVGVLILASRWLPLRYFPLTAGLLQALGCIGGIVGQVPLAKAVAIFGWRHCFLALAILGFVLTFLVFAIVRDWPEHVIQHFKKKEERVSLDRLPFFKSLHKVFGKLQTYWIAIYSFMIWAPIVVFAELWGVPFVRAAYGLSTTAASTFVMWLWIGVAVGSPLFGIWSTRLGQRKLPLITSGLVGSIAAIIAIYFSMPLWVFGVLMFLVGVGASGQTLIFAVVADINPPAVQGTAMGFNNLAVVLGGAICQPIAGYLLRFYWDHQISVDGVPIYSLQAYQNAMFIVPLSYAIAFLVAWFCLKETHCKTQY